MPSPRAKPLSKIETLASWRPGVAAEAEVPFMPARVLLQDFTGVPAVVDLAAMRNAMHDLGGDPGKINPLLPVELVIEPGLSVVLFALLRLGNGAFGAAIHRDQPLREQLPHFRTRGLGLANSCIRRIRVEYPDLAADGGE